MENCYFLKGTGGCGDYINFFFLGLLLSKKNLYNNIFILLPGVHCMGLYNSYFNKFYIPNNLFILSDGDNELSYLNYKYYFDKFNRYDDYNINIQKIDNNFYYTNTIFFFFNNASYFTKMMDLHNIKLNELYNLNLNFSNELNSINNEYYNKVLLNIGNNYICVFDDNLRYNSLFSFKYYNTIFNPNNYPVLFFNEIFLCNRQSNFYFINEILGGIKDLTYYHDIISNAKEVHFSNSFPVCYFKYIFEIFKDKFNNVLKYIYPRHISGINSNLDSKYNLSINKINTMELIDFNNFKFICPINFFSYNNCILDKPFSPFTIQYKSISIQSDTLTSLSGDIIILNSKPHFEKANKFINVIKKENYYHNINYFNKFIINLHSINILGIADHNDIIKKLNPITINLNENKIGHLWNEFNEIKINLFEDFNNINNSLSIFLHLFTFQTPIIYKSIFYK